MKDLYVAPGDDLTYILKTTRGPATIYLKSGVYRCKAELCGDDVALVGENRETTVITYDDYARKIHADGREYNTFRTYTLCVTGRRVRLENLTVENSNLNPHEVGQCVALSVNAKDFRAVNVRLKSTQDTLFLSPFPDDLVIRYRGFIPENQLYMDGSAVQVFENCEILGTVDFIFGCGEAYFENCRIVSLHDDRGYGFVAAPAHSLKQARGFVFHGCDFVSEGAEDKTVFLARPWRDFGKCEFIACRFGKHIKPELYDKWNDTQRDKTARFAHADLKCDFTPAPAGWSRRLSPAETNEIINTLTAHIKR